MDIKQTECKFKSIIRKYISENVDIEFEKTLKEYELDSFTAIHIIVDLELEFEIEFPDYVMVPEMFETIGSLYCCFIRVMSGDYQ